MQCLHIFRNLHFISSRLGQHGSSQYTFANLAAIDILTQYPQHSDAFLRSIRPAETGRIPAHPIERCLDLFYLNTVEHFTMVLPSEANEELAIAPALPYLAAGGNNHLLEIFEAAHSAMLAVLAAPQSAELAVKHMPFYIDALFKVFPENLSARQFRLAYKTVVRITAPPSPLAQSQPLLPSILLEMVHARALHASPKSLSPAPPAPDQHDLGVPLSEQAILTLTLIDSLCFLSVPTLEEWLPIVASLVNKIDDVGMRRACQERFWEAMSSGEMDVERASLCVTWWSTNGGKELVMFGSGAGSALMSGGLGLESKI